jgi:hypothetical protein
MLSEIKLLHAEKMSNESARLHESGRGRETAMDHNHQLYQKHNYLEG